MVASPASLPYRPCVGMMLLNKDGQILVARRIDHQSNYWQMPQGGIDKDETPGVAALRELEEEIDVKPAAVEILDQTEDWIRYDLPADLIGKIWKGKYRGQEQKWFCLRFLGQDTMINLDTDHPEFLDWKWIEPEELTNLVIPFKYHVYEMLIERFGRWFN